MMNSIGHRILHFDKVASTNDIAWSYTSDSANHGLVVSAEEQTMGRGRRGSRWQAPHGTSILASIIIFTPNKLVRPTWLTLWASLAICETISELNPQEPTLKWPNDVLLQGKKVAGVMVEQRTEAFVVGLGINVTTPQDFFEQNNYFTASSIQHFTNEAIQRDVVSQKLLDHLNDSFFWSDESSDRLLANFRRFSKLAGQEISLTSGNSAYLGQIIELNLNEVRLATKQGSLTFVLESISRIQVQAYSAHSNHASQKPIE